MKKIIYIVIAVCAFALNAKAQTELVSTGTGAAYVIAYPAAFSYSAGISITFKAHAASTAGPVTLNINGLGAKTIKKNVTTDLALGDIILNQYVTVMYDGTNFQLTSSVPAGASGWSLTGNAGTTAANFIGTTNVTTLNFRVNNQPSGSINFNNGLTAFGYSSLASNTTGTSNTANGANSLNWNSSGSNNTAVGNSSLLNNSTGSQNTANGSSSMYSNTTGTGNSAIGFFSLFTNSTGNNNSAFGYGSLAGNTTAFQNTASGVSSLFSNTTGNNNTASGYSSLSANTTGANNTAIGLQAGAINKTGSDNTFLGANTNASADNLTNATAIGANAVVSASNSLVLGNSVNVGIGTSTPTAKLDIGGNPGVDGIRFPDGTLQTTAATATTDLWTKTGTNIYPATLTDNVGIGTSTPLSKLHVLATTNTATLTSISSSVASLGAQRFQFSTGDVFDIGFQSAPNYAAWMQAGYNGGAEAMLLNPLGGNVGIGTTNPTNSLSLGNLADQKIWIESSGGTTVGRNLTIAAGSNNGGFNNVNGGNMIIQAGVGTGLGESTISFQNGTTLGNSPTVQTMSTKMTILGNGNVGIGTTTPTAKLHVGGTSGVDGIRFPDGTLQTTAAGASGWSLTGNTGTNPSINFIGTTDVSTLNFKVGGQPAGTINAGNNTTAFGYSALSSNTTGTNNTASGYMSLFSNTTGANNTAIGTQSLFVNTTGSNNTASGVYSLVANTFGNNNTASGYYSLRENTSGSQNTATGSSSLSTNTTGANNTATGYYSLRFNTTGADNTATGSSSLYSNTTGARNTASGVYSLYSNTTGNSNTAHGYASLQQNTSGSYNSASGTGSLQSNTIGTNNTANGYWGLYNNTTGSNNTASGAASLYTNTTGGYNSASGASSLYANTTGSDNTASGYSSLNANTIGTRNTASGSGSLYSNTTGDDNTAIGRRSLFLSSTGNSNTAIGSSSLYFNSTGYGNTANGANSLYTNTTGANNTASGINSLNLNTIGNYNTANGTLSLLVNTTGNYNTASGSGSLSGNTTGGNNTALGGYAGNFNTTGNSNTFIGYDADASVNNLTNATAIGANAVVSASNSLVLGNGANVGIGTASPDATLDVNGNVAFRKPVVDVNLTNGSQINPSLYSYIRFTGSGGTYTLGTPSILAGTVGGQMLIITSTTGSVIIVRHGGIVHLSGGVNYSMGPFDSLTLIWDGSVWIEIARSNNN